jgi:hypothetical protein
VCAKVDFEVIWGGGGVVWGTENPRRVDGEEALVAQRCWAARVGGGDQVWCARAREKSKMSIGLKKCECHSKVDG